MQFLYCSWWTSTSQWKFIILHCTSTAAATAKSWTIINRLWLLYHSTNNEFSWLNCSTYCIPDWWNDTARSIELQQEHIRHRFTCLNLLLEYYGVHTGQRVTSRTPELNEPPTTLGSSGQALQPNSKTYTGDFPSSGPVFTSSSRKVGNIYNTFECKMSCLLFW